MKKNGFFPSKQFFITGRSRVWSVLLLFFCIFSFSLRAEEPLAFSLKGHLSQDTIEKMLEELEKHPFTSSIGITINSSSGHLSAVLHLAQTLFLWKEEGKKQLSVYIDHNALGPAALLVFLADQLYVTPVVSWGDIYAEAEATLPLNVLRSKLSNFSSLKKKTAALQWLIDPMIDPDFVVHKEEGEWKKNRNKPGTEEEIVSPAGEALILNRDQLLDLKSIDGVLARSPFSKWTNLTDTLAPEIDSTGSETDWAAFISPRAQGENRIGLIRIDDKRRGIDRSTWIYVKSALDHYKKTKPLCILLELDTPGGEVFSALQISHALKEMDVQYNIPVIAYVNNWAISAGALLAYSCRFIVTSPEASMGAAAPIILTETGDVQGVGEKMKSPLRAEFANLAHFYSRDPLIAQAMVDQELLIVRRHGRIIQLQSEEEIAKTGLHRDEIISGKNKLLTLNARQMKEWGVANLVLSSTKTDPLLAGEKQQGKWPAGKHPLFHQEFFNAIPQAMIESYETTWRLDFLSLLSNPFVYSLLTLGMLVGFYLEMNTPTFGIAGTVSFLCLVGVLLAHFATESIGWFDIVITLLGFALLAIEFFVTPGFGLVGIAGGILLVMGVILLGLPNLSTFYKPSEGMSGSDAWILFQQILGEKLLIMVMTLLTAIVGLFIFIRWIWPRFGKHCPLILRQEQSAEEGYVVQKIEQDPPPINAKGAALTPLTPSGRVEIAGKVYNVMSESQFVQAGEAIVTVEVRGQWILVKKGEEE